MLVGFSIAVLRNAAINGTQCAGKGGSRSVQIEIYILPAGGARRALSGRGSSTLKLEAGNKLAISLFAVFPAGHGALKHHCMRHAERPKDVRG